MQWNLQLSRNSASFSLENLDVSERNPRLPQNQLSLEESSRKWKVEIGLWKPFVFLWKLLRIYVNPLNPAPVSLENIGVSEAHPPTFTKSTFPIGKLKKTRSGNRVLETMCFAVEIERNLQIPMGSRLVYIGNRNCFRTQFPTFTKSTFLVYVVEKFGSGNRVLETVCFPM